MRRTRFKHLPRFWAWTVPVIVGLLSRELRHEQVVVARPLSGLGHAPAPAHEVEAAEEDVVELPPAHDLRGHARVRRRQRRARRRGRARRACGRGARRRVRACRRE